MNALFVDRKDTQLVQIVQHFSYLLKNWTLDSWLLKANESIAHQMVYQDEFIFCQFEGSIRVVCILSDDLCASVPKSDPTGGLRNHETYSNLTIFITNECCINRSQYYVFCFFFIFPTLPAEDLQL